MTLIDLDKFVGSFITEMKKYQPITCYNLPACIMKALEDQGLEYKDGEIIKSQRRVSAETKETGYGESEDEKIRKSLLMWLQSNSYTNIAGIQINDVIDWFERQGERESDIRYKYLDELLIADDIYQMSMNEAMTNEAKTKAVNALSNLGISKLLGLEKQRQKPAELHKEDEQNLNACLGYIPDEFLRRWLMDVVHVKYDNPADKIEQKFKVGDWITDGEEIGQIIEWNHPDCIGYKTNHGTEKAFYKEYFSNWHRWTIQDAKPGDVLVTDFEEDNMIVMYHSMCTIDTINVCCCLDNKFTCANLGVFDAEDVKPATKEQRDLLFQKMKEKGYEWDAEKKELKKIHVIDEGKAEMDYCFTKMMNGEKVTPACGEDEPQLKQGKYYECIKSYYYLGGGQYWFDKGKVYFCEKDGYLRSDPNNNIYVYDCKNWQSCFRPYTGKDTWKPSDEQINTLRDVIVYVEGCNSNFKGNGSVLENLYNNLKKLTE